jgi:glycerol-3-phosphate dehydrogenase
MDYDHAGTTDIDYPGDPDDITPPPEDVEYILKACNKLFPTAKYTKNDVVATFIGLRPLVSEKGVPEGKVSRDHTIFVDKDGVITVAGGKLTTYRVMAKQAVEKALKILGLSKRVHKCVTGSLPLWGGNIEDWDLYLEEHTKELMQEFDLDEKTAQVVVKMYGSELPMFVKVLTEHGTEKLVEGRPWLEAQVIYSCRYEMVRHPIDFLRRRTHMMFEEGNGENAVNTVATLMAKELNWDETKTKKTEEETIDFINTRIRVDLDKVNLES